MTEQTRDWERGTRETVFAGIRRYMAAATLLALIALPPLLWFTPDLVRVLFSAKNLGAVDATRIVLIAGALRVVYGWTKSFPVSIGRPNLRIWTHAVETVVLVPLTAVFGAEWGATCDGALECGVPPCRVDVGVGISVEEPEGNF
jgi:O-antigen/teichoic acid export membrane protein